MAATLRAATAMASAVMAIIGAITVMATAGVRRRDWHLLLPVAEPYLQRLKVRADEKAKMAKSVAAMLADIDTSTAKIRQEMTANTGRVFNVPKAAKSL